MNDEILVSVICIAYNHEKYIRDALDGFVNQQTDFKYEVLINDDASTDCTAKIIREYEKQYLHIIKPTYQSINQYSQKKSVIEILLNQSHGKYFAICEGDDYWTDNKKLQKQADYMEAHPECSLCIHNAIKVNADKIFLSPFQTTVRDRMIPTEEVVLGNGGFCATNSIFGRMIDVKERPQFVRENGLDYTWQVYLASKGYTYCFNEFMSAYRMAVPNSFTDRMRTDSTAHIGVLQKKTKMLQAFDCYTKQKYHMAVNEVIAETTYEIAVESGDANLLKTKEMQNWIQKKGIKKSAAYVLMKIYPKSVYNLRKKLKQHT